jgi:GMP reductase
MRLINDIKLDFKDVLILPKRSKLFSRNEVNLERTYTFPHSKYTWTGIPIIIANMDATGTFQMAYKLAEYKCITCIHKYYNVEQWYDFIKNNNISDYFAVSIGVRDNDINKLKTIMDFDKNLNKDNGIKFICIDVANGYSELFLEKVKYIRKMYPNKTLIAGNVVTNEMTEELIMNGVDIVKAGIGGGSVCTTRIKTGIGYPQLSMVIECADAAHGLKGMLMSDGGCTNSGDIVKAFGAGADFVMLGGMMAGHDESHGAIIEENGIKYKEFYGMSSSVAMNKYSGGIAKYRASEGKRVLIKYRGPIADTMNDILGGIRSTCTYVGASTLKELSKRTTFIRVSQQSNEVYGKN